jgi:hypothetical protein
MGACCTSEKQREKQPSTSTIDPKEIQNSQQNIQRIPERRRTFHIEIKQCEALEESKFSRNIVDMQSKIEKMSKISVDNKNNQGKNERYKDEEREDENFEKKKDFLNTIKKQNEEFKKPSEAVEKEANNLQGINCVNNADFMSSFSSCEEVQNEVNVKGIIEDNLKGKTVASKNSKKHLSDQHDKRSTAEITGFTDKLTKENINK